MARAGAWAIVLASLALLATLAEFSLRESSLPPVRGLKTELINGVAVVTYVLPAGDAWDSGMRPGDQILEADGGPAAMLSEAALNSATSFTVTTQSGITVHTPALENLPDTPAKDAAFLIIAGIFAILGATVVVVTDALPLALLFFTWTMCVAVSLVTPLGEVSGRTWPHVLEEVGFIAFGASTAVLFFLFPVNRSVGRFRPFALWVVPAWHASLVFVYAYAVAADSQVYAPFQPILLLTLAADICAAIISVSAPLVAAVIRRCKPPAANTVLLIGVGAGLLPFALLSLVPHSLGFGFLVPPDTTILTLILLPMSLAATMGRLFAIRSWLRRGLIRLFVWTLLLSGYGLALAIVQGRVAAGSTAAQVLVSPFVIVVAIGATLPLLERTLRTKLETALLQDVYNFPTALQRFTSRIVDLRTAEDIANYALASLGETLDLSWTALALLPPDERIFQWGTLPPGVGAALLSGDGVHAGAAEVTELSAEGNTVGVLAAGQKRHDLELQPEDRLMMRTIAPLLAIALQLVRQLEIVAARESQLESLSQQVLDVQEDVRRRIALEIHDDAMQRAILLAREFQDRERQPLDGAESLIELVIALRSVCTGLYPTVLDDLGLPAGLEQLVNELRAKTELAAELLVDAPDDPDFGRLDREMELALYRIAQESLNNVRKHAFASHVQVTLRRREDTVELVVADDGSGEAPEAAVPGDGLSGLGITGMRHRLVRWGGSLSIADRAGGGTEVRAQVALASVA